MTLTERLYTMKQLPLLSGLGETELFLLAEVSRWRTFAPGKVLHDAGENVSRLYLTLSGQAEREDGTPVAGVFDVVSLLYGQPIAQSLRVSKTAPLECLCLSKGHFFTLINECPGVLLNLLKPESWDSVGSSGVIR